MQVDRGASKWDVLPFDMRVLRQCLARWQEGLADVGWNSLYWDNHDQPRVVSRFGDDGDCRVESAKLLATVLQLQRGTPYVYQGDELGMTNFPFTSIDDFQDIESVNYYRHATEAGVDEEHLLAAMRHISRDNARTPMQWDDGPNAGFTTGKPWLAVNPNHREINAAAQVDDPHSVFSHYQRVIRLRHDLPVVADGDFAMLLPDDDDVYAFTRGLAGDQLLVLGNFSSGTVPVELPDGQRWSGSELLLSNYPDSAEDGAGLTSLRAWEAVVYRRVQA
jgi:oligo-1,6-glucosidase